MTDSTRPAMRIAMIGLRGIPATYGGIEHAVEEIGTRLVERGHQVTVYCRSRYLDADGHGTVDNDTIDNSTIHNDTIHNSTYRSMQRKVLPAPRSRYLEALVHSGLATCSAMAARYDILHFHALGPGIFTPLARLAPGAAVVQTIHGLDDQRAKWAGGAGRLLHIGRTLSAYVPDATIVVSQALRDSYLETFGRTTHYIPNGITPVDWPLGDEGLERFGLQPGRYVLFVGRLVPEKRVELLIETAALLDDPDLRFVIVGGSSHSDDYAMSLRERAAGDPRIVFCDYVFGEQLLQLYRSAAVFVLPSDLEGLPLVLLEAINMACPVVVSDIDPHREIVERSAPGHRLFDHGCARSLADALADEIADPETGRYGIRELRHSALLRYSWDRVADETEALYRRLLGWS